MNQIFSPMRLTETAMPISATRDGNVVGRAASVATDASQRAKDLDEDGSFPSDDVRALAAADLLTAPLPQEHGGEALGLEPAAMHDLARVLMKIGSGSLPLGRLYEGHVNALRLVTAYGQPRQLALIADRVRRGHMLAVWNTQAADGVRLVGTGASLTLQGRKIFASGAGRIVHPLITARADDGRSLMVIPTVDEASRADLSDWTPQGMRASASGAVDFSGLPIDDEDIIGGPDDFLRQPLFSTGAWRFAAVQTGGIAAVFDAARDHLRKTGRADDPHQRSRMGQAAISLESARQWIFQAARLADDDGIEPEVRIAHVNLARSAVEQAGLDVLELAQRSVGLAGFSRTHPLEKLSRDLATYLRQPNPDKAIGDAGAFVLASDTRALDMFPWR